MKEPYAEHMREKAADWMRVT